MEGIGLQQEIEGLSTRQALTLLHDEIEERLVIFQTAFNASRWRLPFQVFRMGNRKSSFHWSSIVIFILCCTALLIAYGIPLSTRSDVLFYKDVWWPVEAFTLLVILALCCYLTGWDYALEREEIARVLLQTLHKVKECSRTCTWNQRNYPDIHSPISPSVSLQWTLREGEVVNMPRSLLVKGDIILLRPGQTVPARCRDLENESGPELLSGEVFAPSVNRGSETFSLPQGRSPLKAQKFVLLKTPYIENLNMMLSGQCERPVSLLDNERYYVCTTWIERRVVPVVFCLLLLVNTLRYVYLRDTVGDWPEMLLVLPIHALIPLLPVAFPWLWKLLNYYGEARLLTAFEVCKVQKAPVSEGSFDSDSVISADEARVNMDWQQVLHNMWLIVSGRSPLITRQTNIMHVMGSVTSFCCVDKKGVLSWANPTAEKVFIMTPNPSNKPAANIETQPNNAKEAKLRKRKRNALSSSDHVIPVEQSCHFEVLDLTHDAKSTFGLQFDDPNWKKNLTSLKPLGLSLLLNTCNPGAKAWYSQFTDHVASSAIKNKETVAVVNRRCLCELSKQIGFSEKATVLFDLEQCFGIYRQVPAAEAAKERMHRAHSTVQHKIPMPNMVSVVVRDSLSGTCQLMSQGTADIILDTCSDYWDGSDLRPINQSDRKKMLDFYHRTSMASYCTAFSYRPLSQGISDSLQNYFIELPENSANINPHIVHGESCSSSPDGSESELSRSISVDSLMVSNTALPVEDVAGCFTAQSQQIFIGMITMQYQARQDIIQLIDQLETACIRFVHFSEENELRSRVFSEKMGLEAGWNCHISLLPPEARSPRHSVQEENSHRTSRYSSCVSTDNIHRGSPPKVRIEEDSPNSLSKSYSAPSLMNADNPQVKFRPDNHTTDISPTANQHYGHGGREEYRETDETKCLIGQAEIEGPLGEMSSSDDGQDIQYEIQTSSRITVNTLDSLTAMLDNRAKLPRGIEDIRPHLEHVDNVPLLVSLFTDCTQPATCEMIKIMQEYGEVVLCLGSSANIHNTGIFLQSDGSVGVQPLLPQLCARQEVMIDPWEEDRLSPIQLASSLLTLPCSLAFKREDNIHFVQLIAEARHYLMMLRNCFQLMLCCELSVSLVQVLGSVLLHLPPVLAGRHLLWLVCVVIPALCLTMMGNQVDTRIMAEATSKNSRTINKEVILQFLLYYGLRFVPSVSVCLVCCGFNSVAVCSTVLANSSNQTDCVFFQYKEELGVWNSWDDSYRGQISLIQNFALFQMVLYFVLISMSYVHKYSHIWQSPPYRNKYWLVVSLTLVLSEYGNLSNNSNTWVLCQLVYFACDVSVSADPPSLSLIPPWSWAVALAWPVLLLIYTELLKMQEIKLMVRFQKRARLNFGTKLGMNSPF